MELVRFIDNIDVIFPKLDNNTTVLEGLKVGAEIFESIRRDTPVDKMISNLADISFFCIRMEQQRSGKVG